MASGIGRRTAERADLGRAEAVALTAGVADPGGLASEHAIADEAGYPVSQEILLVWTMMAAHQPLFRSRGIRLDAVSPGPVETPILSRLRVVAGDARLDQDIAVAGRAGIAADLAPVVLFLCSDAARWVNGANIPTDGGLEASVNAGVMGF